jgi:hypothetical protein
MAAPDRSASAGAVAAEGWRAGALSANTTEQLALAPGSLLSGEAIDRAVELAPGRSGMSLDADGATDGVFGMPPSAALKIGGGGAAEDAARPCWMSLTQPGVLAVRVSHALEKPSRRPGGGDVGRGPWDEAAWVEAQQHRLVVLWGVPPPPPPAELPVWAAVSADFEPGFLCVEPWQSGPDSLNTGAGLVVLGPGQRAEWAFRIQVSDLRS